MNDRELLTSEDRENPVVSVVSAPSSDHDDHIAPSQKHNGRGTLGLCPPPATDVVPVVSGAETTRSGSDSDETGEVGVVSPSSDEAGPADAASDEQLHLLALVGTDKDPYQDGGPWAYADGENCGGRVFFVTQNERHESGVELLSAERVARAVEKKGMSRWAWIKHDKDVYTEEEAAKLPRAVAGAPKEHHFHVAIERKSFATIGVIARAFGVPPQQVELKPQGSFLDLVEYLTHENPNQQAKGKHLYADEEVHANFEWREELDDHKLARSFKAGKRANAKKLDRIFVAVNRGEMTLSQVREQEPELYASKGTLSHLSKLRGDFLAHQEAPESVMNFYVFGPGGVGKDLLAKALARGLAPDAEKPYFKVGGENVSWEEYDGEPVVIWEDMRVGDMVRTAKSRGMLFRILGPWREPDEKPIVNIKNSHTQLLNRVNIVTGPEGYESFLRGLAGEYVSMQSGVKVKHEAENVDQGFRRFPVIIPVSENEFAIYVNLGALNGTREYQSYEKYEHMRQDLELLRRRCKAIQDEAERQRVIDAIEAKTVAPIVAQHDRIALPELPPMGADDLLAEFADAGEVIPPEERARRVQEAASERVRVYEDAVEACRRDLREWMALCAAHHGIEADDPHLRGHAEIWRNGQGCSCAPGGGSHEVWPFMEDLLVRSRAIDEALSDAWQALTAIERRNVERHDARQL